MSRWGSDLSSRMDSGPNAPEEEIIFQGSEYMAKVDINDAVNRALLTKGPVQADVHRDTGAVVSTKGVYYPNRSVAPTDGEPPLFLEVTAKTPDEVRRGVEAVRAIMAREPERHGGDRHGGDRPFQPRPPRGPRPEVKVPVDVESHHRWFNVRSKVVGPGGMFVKYIQEETGTRVQIKGRGSGYIEYHTGMEADEPTFIHIIGHDPEQVREAHELAEDLMEVVREEYAKTKAFYEGGETYTPRSAPTGPAAGTYDAPYRGSPAGAIPPSGSAGATPPSGPAAERLPTAAASASPVAASRVEEKAQSESAEQETLDKYWHDYISWEKAFVEYHNREPRPEEGKQQIPPEYN